MTRITDGGEQVTLFVGLSHVIPSVNRQDDVRLAAETDVGHGVFFPLRSPHCGICGMLAVGERL